MISVNAINHTNNSVSLYALSTDALPVDKIVLSSGSEFVLKNGSDVYLMDTGEIKIFSEGDHTWYTM